MSTIVRLVLLAFVLTGATAATANPAPKSSVPDRSKPYGGFDPNSQEGQRAFWDKMTRH